MNTRLFSCRNYVSLCHLARCSFFLSFRPQDWSDLQSANPEKRETHSSLGPLITHRARAGRAAARRRCGIVQRLTRTLNKESQRIVHNYSYSHSYSYSTILGYSWHVHSPFATWHCLLRIHYKVHNISPLISNHCLSTSKKPCDRHTILPFWMSISCTNSSQKSSAQSKGNAK